MGREIVRRIGTAVAVVACCLGARQAVAADLRSGQTIVVRAAETVPDDLYAAGHTIQILGTIDGDLVVAGDEVSVTGSVGGDLIALGGTVTISGPVNGVVRALGGRVVLDSSVEFDALLGGGEIVVGPGARVARDVLLGFGDAQVAGKVERNVRAWTESLQLLGTAVVGGNLVYSGGKPLRREPTAVVRGRAAQVEGTVAVRASPEARLLRRGFTEAKGYAGIAFAALALVLLAPAFARNAGTRVSRSPWASLGLGAALLVLTPLCALALTIAGWFIGAWWIGAGIFVMWLLALPVAYAVACLRIGTWITESAKSRFNGLMASALVGLAVVAVLGFIPFAGWGVRALALVIGLGAMALAGADAVRAQHASVTPQAPIAMPAFPRFTRAVALDEERKAS